MIVFRLPPNPKINYIKRLVGLPGDRIRVDENNQVYINDVLQPQTPDPSTRGPKQDPGITPAFPPPSSSWAASAIAIMFANGSVKTGEWVVPPGHYFFMGDNRNNSKDSRFRTIGCPGVRAGRRIWWVRRSGFGLILIPVTDLSGIGSEMRFNKGCLQRSQFMRQAPAGHDIDRVALHAGIGRGDRLRGIRLLPRLSELHESRAQHGCHGRASSKATPRSRPRCAARSRSTGRSRTSTASTAKDVEITKDDGVTTHACGLRRFVPYIANVSLVVHFDKTVKVQ